MEVPNPNANPNPISSSSLAVSPSPSSSTEPFDDADPEPEPELELELDEPEPDTVDDDLDTAEQPSTLTPTTLLPPSKKPKKKNTKNNNNNLWTKSTSRKGKKKAKPGVNQAVPASNAQEDNVVMTPAPRLPDRSDDSVDAIICLSRVSKAERVELSDDRLTAGSTKGYRMVRATRGVMQGAWYFEIRVTHLGETGHTRLGWSTDKGDLQAPVGYDTYSYGYRDIDGSRIHKALREKYSDEGYKEGNVIGFYINLPDGEKYAPKKPRLVCIKGQRYFYPADGKDEPPMIVPGSEIIFFKNGVSQGVAFTDLFGGRYYPAASMYTLPGQPNCKVTFNFGPDFNFLPEDFGDRPMPRPMIEVEYHGLDYIEGPAENGVVAERVS